MSAPQELLSRDEALQFVTKCLEIDDVETKLQSKRLYLLDEMIRKYHECIPFTNLIIMSTDPSERKVPSARDMINSVTTRNGGVCITHNGFFKMLLEALKYTVVFVRAKIYISKVEDPHVTLIASNVEKEGDLYNVDVGIGYPTFKAIPLHDDNLPKEYQFAFHYVKFKKVGDVFVRCHKKMSPFGEMKDRQDDIWDDFIEFDLTPRELSFFDKSMNVIFTNESISILLNIAYASIYPPGKAITLRDLTLRVWNEETGQITTTMFDSYQKATPVIVAHFPMIDENIVKQGYAYWLEVQKRKKINGKD